MGISQKDVGSRPLRILHVVGGMDRGGLETWLMHVLRTIDRTRFTMDFLVHAAQPCAYDEEIRALGSRVIYGGDHHSLWGYKKRFDEVLALHGPYDVVHSHVAYFSGRVLRLAAGQGVRVRIAHSHSDRAAREAKFGIKRRLYVQLMQRMIRRFATAGLAASEPAAASLFGANWASERSVEVVHCGLDFSPYAEPIERAQGREQVREQVRAELGIAPDALLIGHVGRFEAPKNHAHLLEVARSLRRREPRAWLLMVGDGALRADTERRASEVGLDQVVFAGVREDVPRLLRAMDVFVFPSIFEGLGLALVEAQAAGLPCVISQSIPQEADVVPELVCRMGLEQQAGLWAEAVLQMAARPRPSARQAHRVVANSSFCIAQSVENLVRIYGR
ncbi:MAG: glycosyltransferase family 1 protein [Bradymonadaceae bacterium]|nr:glycosyltransferase family 1 protein [Lujinxingiaceae bacterium]